MFCKNRITLIGFIGNDAETRSTTSGTAITRFSLATNVSWREKDSEEYRTRTEWHQIVTWRRLAEWSGSLKKGAYVEVEGELRYREFKPQGSDNKVRVAEVHAQSILLLNHSEKSGTRNSSAAEESCDEDSTL